MNNLKEYQKKQYRVFGEFLHEIKTPLTIIRTHLESEIINESLPIEVRQKLVLDVEEVARINHLVNDMKTILTHESEIIKDNFQKQSLLEVVMDVVESLEPIAEMKEQRISLVSQQNCNIWMDKHKLKQLFFNLISNALKYSSNESEVEVFFLIETDYISVTIKDNGIGIDLKEQDKVFDAFYRVSNLKEEGTGLGLAVSNSIALLHNAQIILTSRLAKGSSFTVKFKV